jgi:hypothetical protein
VHNSLLESSIPLQSQPSKLKIVDEASGIENANQSTIGDQTVSTSGLLLLWYLHLF